MKKLTDTDYQLPTIEALAPFDSFETGTTLPMGIWGVDTQSGVRGQYVVKFKGYSRMSESSSAYELIASWMAIELGLPAAKPVLVDISSEFVENTMRGNEGYRAAANSLGLNFGSEYLSGYSNFSAHSLSDTKFETVKLIYVFDLFIQNIDRGHQKPNIACNGSKLFIYDHELAFSYLNLFSFARNPEPWNFGMGERDLYKKQFFYKYLKEKNPDLTVEANKMKCFNLGFWDKVYKNLPEEWLDDKIRQIEPFLTSILENCSYFAESLNKTFTS